MKNGGYLAIFPFGYRAEENSLYDYNQPIRLQAPYTK